MPIKKTMLVTMLFASAATSFSLLGCATTPARPNPAQPDPLAQDGYPAVTVEQSLRKGVVVDYGRIVFDEPTRSTPAVVQVPLRSNTTATLNIQYQFSWFDADGRFVRNGGWKFVSLPRGQERIMQANAIDARSSAYRLEIRSAQ